MRIGPIEFKWKGFNKTWTQLDTMIRREGSAGAVALKTNPKTQLESYRSWVYSCVSLISDRLSSLPYGFYNKDTGEELNTTNKGYRVFTKPFVNPNDLMSFRFIKSFCQLQLDLCGMTIIYKAKNQLGQVWELWPLNMNDFLKVESDGNMVNPKVKYFFKSGGGWIEFDNSELIVINYPNPVDLYTGMSPIQSQAYASDIDNYVEVYERDFFKNSARIDFALSTDAQIDQEKADELKERWMEKYKGSFHEVAVLDSGLKPIPLNYTNKDFEFLNLAGWSKEKILGCYRVPSSKLGSTDTNRAGSVYSDISFNRESIQPRLTLWDEEMTMGVCATYDPRLEIKHQNPIPRDRQIELQEGKSYLSTVPSMTINEFRTKIHKLPEVTGGDRILLKTGTSYVFLDELEKVPVEDRLGLVQPNDGADPDDRTDEEPHTNPDGSDDRDDNPTDGRSFDDNFSLKEFSSLLEKSRAIWNVLILDTIKDIDPNDLEKELKQIFIECISASIDVYSQKWNPNTFIKVDVNDWVTGIAEKTSSEYTKTLFKDPKWQEKDWSIYFEEQHNSNPRLSKLINAMLKSTINYTKWLILKETDQEIEWIINSNECGHKGRLDSIYSKDSFKVGQLKIRFPGETLNFYCDCTITNRIKEII
jgi:HK97 family phage portal protein